MSTGPSKSPSNMDEAAVAIRPIGLQDVDACRRIAHAAHIAVTAAHNVPSKHPWVEFPAGLIANKVKDPNAVGFVAERDGRVLGSVFINTYPGSPVAAIGPLTVDPTAEGARRFVVQAALEEARNRGVEQVRLIQSLSQLWSVALYANLGFQVRDLLLLFSGKSAGQGIMSCHVRPAGVDDIAACDRLCAAAHGFTRTFELRAAIQQRTARVVERGHLVSGYTTGLGFGGHAVGQTTDDLKALIDATTVVLGSGFFVPTRNGELLDWLFHSGFRASWPAMLMTMGPYQDPARTFLPSLAF